MSNIRVLQVFYASAAVAHVLVIAKIIPYSWVNGGMSDSYQEQMIQSVSSLVVLGLLFLFVRHMSKPKVQVKFWQRLALKLITAFWVIGFMLQLLGTPFERYVLSITLAIGVIGHAQLIRSFRTHIKA